MTRSFTDEETKRNPLMMSWLQDEVLLKGKFVALEPFYMRNIWSYPHGELCFRSSTQTPGDEATPRLDRLIKYEIRSIAASKAARTRKLRKKMVEDA